MASDPTSEALLRGCAELGITLDAKAVERFGRLRAMLYATNAEMNLTRVPEAEFVQLHCLDSLLLRRAYDPVRARSLLDIGTGAGFPGLPLKIAWPHLRVTMVDGTLKKLKFVESVVQELGLSGVRLVHGRAEGPIRELVGGFDLVVARAVAPLDRLAPWMAPYVRPGGRAVAYKGAEVAEELAAAADAIGRCGLALEASARAPLPDSEITRTLVTLAKPPAPRPTAATRPVWRRKP